MKLSDKFYLCYVNTSDLFIWIKENNLIENSFQNEKNKWRKLISKKPNFFSDTELLLLDNDIMLLKTMDDNHTSFLAKNYKLEYQKVCQAIFQAKKTILIISDQQWKEPKFTEKLIVLFKDIERIRERFSD